jgi:hypothetical protein
MHVWVTIRTQEGSIRDIELDDDLYIEIGDVLEDGSVVLDLPYPDDTDEDFIAMGEYDDLDDETEVY